MGNMCNEVCECCEKDVCKCPNYKDPYITRINTYMSHIRIDESSYEVKKMDDKRYRIMLNDVGNAFWVSPNHIYPLGEITKFNIGLSLDKKTLEGNVYFV